MSTNSARSKGSGDIGKSIVESVLITKEKHYSVRGKK